jgi:nucleotide-binding universal stress UspA family protein
MDDTLHQATHKTARAPAFRRIAVGVDGYPEGSDAVALGAGLARAIGADLMLVTVHHDPLVVMPTGMDWSGLRRQARAGLEAERDSRAPDARIDVESDLSVPRALKRVVDREHRDLLVLGSSRKAPVGRIRIGKRTRQLLCHFECSLAVAPRGYRERSDRAFERVAVGYDGEPESVAALAAAATIASSVGAELLIHAVVDDRLPTIPWMGVATASVKMWEQAVDDEVDALTAEAELAASQLDSGAHVELERGRPANSLLSLTERTDLLVIGSRRWGPMNRVLLGSTGEAVMHDAACPVLAVPRPAD